MLFEIKAYPANGGNIKYTLKLFLNFRLSQQITADNFYKILKQVLDLNFIYEDTKDAYSNTIRPGIDPIVFFKILFVG